MPFTGLESPAEWSEGDCSLTQVCPLALPAGCPEAQFQQLSSLNSHLTICHYLSPLSRDVDGCICQDRLTTQQSFRCGVVVLTPESTLTLPTRQAIRIPN